MGKVLGPLPSFPFSAQRVDVFILVCFSCPQRHLTFKPSELSRAVEACPGSAGGCGQRQAGSGIRRRSPGGLHLGFTPLGKGCLTPESLLSSSCPFTFLCPKALPAALLPAVRGPLRSRVMAPPEAVRNLSPA